MFNLLCPILIIFHTVTLEKRYICLSAHEHFPNAHYELDNMPHCSVFKEKKFFISLETLMLRKKTSLSGRSPETG